MSLLGYANVRNHVNPDSSAALKAALTCKDPEVLTCLYQQISLQNPLSNAFVLIEQKGGGVGWILSSRREYGCLKMEFSRFATGLENGVMATLWGVGIAVLPEIPPGKMYVVSSDLRLVVMLEILDHERF